jgi:hypothetical protein
MKCVVNCELAGSESFILTLPQRGFEDGGYDMKHSTANPDAGIIFIFILH